MIARAVKSTWRTDSATMALPKPVSTPDPTSALPTTFTELMITGTPTKAM